MKNWVILTVLYAMFNGLFQCSKKKAAERNSIYEVLAWFSLVSFLLVAFTSKNIFNVELSSLLMILCKSIVVLISWMLGVYALNKMPISLYSVINLSRIIFSILMSVILLGEKITTLALIGIIIVIIGLGLVNKNPNEKEEKECSLKMLIIVLVACLLNSISAIIDKKILQDINSNQLQFWFLLFLTIGYWLILLVRKEKINFKSINKNYWIPIAAICLTLGDRLLFIANEIPESKVSIMTLIKQLTAIESIILGKIVFKEKNIIKKLLCSVLIIFGIVLTLI